MTSATNKTDETKRNDRLERIASGIARLGFSGEVKVNAISRDAKFVRMSTPTSAWLQLAESLMAELDGMTFEEANEAGSDGVPHFWQLTDLDSFDRESQAYAFRWADEGYVFEWFDDNGNALERA